MVDFPGETGPMHCWPTVQPIDGALELLKRLNPSAGCHIATNAKDSSQVDIRKALERGGIAVFIHEIFCFQQLGVEKPSGEFFEKVLQHLNVEKSEIVMIGDDLEKDVLGAIDFGISAIWYNPKNLKVPRGIASINSLESVVF